MYPNLMYRTADSENVALSDGSASTKESIDDALSFGATQACHDVNDKAICGDLEHGLAKCFWGSGDEDAQGSCEGCCVQKAGSPLIFFFCAWPDASTPSARTSSRRSTCTTTGATC